ncbi:hypothetical protein [Ligilactobacillus murinus]|uniref:hypothetical protein n=1 Tax=Ligilactobacillus murinus TaxID=1622 RepID=UPI0013D2D5AB|nr:hypothetical protein [Ligilactobacillus murinus]
MQLTSIVDLAVKDNKKSTKVERNFGAFCWLVRNILKNVREQLIKYLDRWKKSLRRYLNVSDVLRD